MPKAGMLSFTKKGRLKVCSMPILWGKEWGAIKELLSTLSSIDKNLESIATSLKEEVMLKQEELQVA